MSYQIKPISIISSLLLLTCCLIYQIDAHGMMLNPTGRSSRWRYDASAPANYDDNGLFCGGFWKQTANDGKCGMCGDDYSLSTPRPNELGGKYGQGVIVKSYAGVNTVNINVRITANHLGHFTFHLCNLDKFGSESEECFNKYPLDFVDGNRKYSIGSTIGNIDVVVQLPKDVKCKHCVLRWTYTAGNNWGVCEDGTGAMGCGPQEHFVSCADVSIIGSVDHLVEVPVET